MVNHIFLRIQAYRAATELAEAHGEQQKIEDHQSPEHRQQRQIDSGFAARHQLPGRIRIVRNHGRGDFLGVRAEVFFVNAALLVDDEGHDTRLAPIGWIGHQRVARDHVSVDNVAVLAAGRVRALSGKNLEVVSMIGSTLSRGFS